MEPLKQLLVLFSIYCAFGESSRPRTISDLETILSTEGVPVDYRYNETGSEVSSAPGCPKSIDGYPWILYGKPPQCFLAGHQGPCEDHEILLQQSGTSNGICVCGCLEDEKIVSQLNETGRYLLACSAFGLIYDKHERRCYKTFEVNQGPCQKDTAIVDWTVEALTCHPICDRERKDTHYWEAMGRLGLCDETPDVEDDDAESSDLSEDECESGERYSKILEKCNKIQPISAIP